MNILLKTTFFLFCCMAAGLLAAQQKPLFANCEMGEGCTFKLSDLTYEEMDIVEGTNGKYSNMSKDGMVVFTKVNGKWENYIEDKLSRSQLDRKYGGDGFTMIYVFDPKLQPLDGQWKVDVGNPTGTACYVNITSILRNGLAGASQRGEVTFPKPFNIRFLMNNHNVRWMMLKPDKYRGVLDFGQGASSPMKLVFDISLINEKKIEGMFTVTIKVPTKETCISKVPVTYLCVKPNKERKNKQDDPFAEPEKPNVERIPDEKRTEVERIPDEKKPNVERIPDEKRTNVERIPDTKKTNVERIPDEKKPNVERIPDEKRTKVERIPDEKKPNVERIPEKKKPKVERLP